MSLGSSTNYGELDSEECGSAGGDLNNLLNCYGSFATNVMKQICIFQYLYDVANHCETLA